MRRWWLATQLRKPLAIRLNPVTPLAAGLLVSLSFGCSFPALSPNSTSDSARAQDEGQYVEPRPFNEILDDLEKGTNQRLIVELRSFIAKQNNSGVERQEAAYILARTLQKNAPVSAPQPATNGAATSDTTVPINGFNSLRESLALYREAARIPALFDRAHWHASEVANTLGDEQAVRESLTALANKATGEAKAAPLYGIAQSYVRTSEPENARGIFEQIIKQFPNSQFATGSAYYLAEMALSRGAAPEGSGQVNTGAAEALPLLRHYLRHSPDGRFAADVIARLTSLAQQGAVTLTAADYDAIGSSEFARGRCKEALAAWSYAPPESHLFSKASCLMRTGQPALAKEALFKAMAAHPDSKSYASIATAIGDPLSREATLQLWKEVLAHNPKHADTAIWNIATRMPTEQATGYFRDLIARFPTSEFAPESTWWLFWNDVKAGNNTAYTRAIGQARFTIERYPETRAATRMSFWSGKLYERLKQPELARKSYRETYQKWPSNYYGYRAAARLHALSAPDKYDPSWSTQPGRTYAIRSWSWPEPAELQAAEKLPERFGATISVLLRLKQYDEALHLLPAHADRLFKAWLQTKVNEPLSAINTATRNIQGRPSTAPLWKMSYPLVYPETISKNAAEKGVDPFLVHALIREESRYNPKALSRSKAIGLMQLLPGTGYGVAKRIGVPLSSKDDIFIPEINMKLGTDYLSYAIKRFSGNAMLGVASYNGGPGAVQRWVKQHQATGSSDWDMFVENIPYRETRDYVRKVFASYWNYLQIYGKEARG